MLFQILQGDLLQVAPQGVFHRRHRRDAGLPVYDAGGTADRSLNSDALAARLRPESVVLADGIGAAADWCGAHIREYDAFVTCGARDPELPALAARISEMKKGAEALT